MASYLQDIQCIVQKTTRFLVELSFFKTYKGFTVETAQDNSLNSSYLRDPSQLKKLLLKMDTLLIVLIIYLFFFN